MFVFEVDGSVLLFDSAFDVKSDEYQSAYVVYELSGLTLAKLESLVDWRQLPNQGRVAGSIDVKDIKFDSTNRRFVDSELLHNTVLRSLRYRAN